MSNKNVTKKLLNVLKKVSKVQKSGHNKHQNYHYSTESDLIDAVRPHLLAEGLVLTTSVEEVSTTDTLTIVKMKHLLIDSETGEQLEMFSQGFGNLTVGKDKSVFAAQTGSFKYFLSKNFMIASEDDPENDEFEDKPTSVSTNPRTFNKPGMSAAPKLAVTSPTHKVETKQVGAVTQVTLSGPVPEEPKEELIKPAAATPTVSKVFQRRTTLNSNKEPNF